MEEKQHRRAFLETRQSLEVKLVIEEQSAEQVGIQYIFRPQARFCSHGAKKNVMENFNKVTKSQTYRDSSSQINYTIKKFQR